MYRTRKGSFFRSLITVVSTILFVGSLFYNILVFAGVDVSPFYNAVMSGIQGIRSALGLEVNDGTLSSYSSKGETATIGAASTYTVSGDDDSDFESDYVFDETFYIYRTLLSDNAQVIYDQIYTNALEYNTSTFELAEGVSIDELEDAMEAVFNDHPELFWLDTSYKYAYNTSGTIVQAQLNYCISEAELDSAKAYFNSQLSGIVAGAQAYSYLIERELYIHDAICDMTTYNLAAAYNQSAYSVFAYGSSVCAGYARAFQLACHELGIPCYYVTGTASGGDHAWNIIYLDGNYYNVDVTWDDTISESYGASVFTYFNLTDAAISADHVRSELSSLLPSCTATAMNYETVYGNTITVDDIEHREDHQLTDGDFTIHVRQEPIVEWRDEAEVHEIPAEEPVEEPIDDFVEEPAEEMPYWDEQENPEMSEISEDGFVEEPVDEWGE